MDGFWEPLGDASLVEDVKAFVAERITPIAHQLDEEDVYATDLLKEMARRGWNTFTLPTTYGGGGGRYRGAAAICEEVAYGSAGVAISLITIFQAQTMINLFGSQTLKDRVLPRFAEG